MTTVVDYASLSQAISDWAHRSDLPPYVDTFIQRAQSQIERDIPAANFGNYIRFQEAAYTPTDIVGGAAPIPADWLGPKTFQIQDGAGNTWPLIFKAVTWLYNAYPQRTSQGLPAYIARDTVGVGGPAYLISSTQDFSTTFNQTGFALTIPTGAAVASVTLDGAYLANGTDYSITAGTLTLVNGTAFGQDLEVTYLASPAGFSVSPTSQFIFGPYPDSDYTLQGTYYATAPLLSVTQTTNWMVLSAPMLLLAACMAETALFLKDLQMLQVWQTDYTARLAALVKADKAERWAASTLAIDVA